MLHGISPLVTTRDCEVAEFCRWQQLHDSFLPPYAGRVPNQAMNTFSFRADCIQVVFDLTLSPGMKAIHRLTILPDQAFPDVEVELVTEMTEAELRRVSPPWMTLM